MKYIVITGALFILVSCITNNSYLASDESNLISRKVRDVQANEEKQANKVNSAVDAELTGFHLGSKEVTKENKTSFKEAIKHE